MGWPVNLLESSLLRHKSASHPMHLVEVSVSKLQQNTGKRIKNNK